MKNLTRIGTFFWVAFSFLACTEEHKEALDSLNSLDCLERLIELSDNGDDYTCSQLASELDKIERSCAAYLDDEDKANFEALKSSCED